MSVKLFVCKEPGVQYCNWCAGMMVILLLFCVSFSSDGMAETRHHESHVHGMGKLNLAIDGKKLILELMSPAANIVGFEHDPVNAEQEHAVHEAIELMKKGDKLFALPPRAECIMQAVHVENDMAAEIHEEHDSHDHGKEKAHADNHDSEGGEHSDFTATYHFECVHPEHLKTVDVLLFSIFEGFEELDVQLITPSKQTAVELTPKKHLLSL